MIIGGLLLIGCGRSELRAGSEQIIGPQGPPGPPGRDGEPRQIPHLLTFMGEDLGPLVGENASWYGPAQGEVKWTYKSGFAVEPRLLYALPGCSGAPHLDPTGMPRRTSERPRSPWGTWLVPEPGSEQIEIESMRTSFGCFEVKDGVRGQRAAGDRLWRSGQRRLPGCVLPEGGDEMTDLEWGKRRRMKLLILTGLLASGCGDRTFPPVIFTSDVDLRVDDGDSGIRTDEEGKTKKHKGNQEVHSIR